MERLMEWDSEINNRREREAFAEQRVEQAAGW